MAGLKRKIRQSLLSFLYRKLWVRIAVILSMVVTIPIIFLGALLIRTSQEAVRNSVLSNYKQVATRAAAEIGLYVQGPQNILSTTAQMIGAVHQAPWKQETILVELALNQPNLMRVLSVDISGKVLASSELGKGSERDYPAEALKGAAGGEFYISRIEFQDNHTPFVTMAVPVKKVSKVIGMLIADVNLRGMWGIADNIRIGKTGKAYLVSREGTLIAGEDKKKILKGNQANQQKEGELVPFERTEAVENLDKTGKKMISAYAPIPGMEWRIVLQQDQDEAYAFSRVMKLQSWIIIFLSELAAILASIFIARALARPIQNLAFKIKSVSEGNFDHRIEAGVKDEIGTLIRSFNDMTRKLKTARERERLSAIGEAVAGITHELKNSFVSIKSFVQMFPKRHKDEVFVDKFNRLVPQEINRLEQKFKELSDFSSHHDLMITRTDMRKVIDSVVEMMREGCAEKKIEIACGLEPGELYAEADAERLRQVLMNLVLNSINAMPNGGILTISACAACSNGVPEQIEVRITDTGKGMSSKEKERLFEPFRTSHDGGMGLGLTISRKIIEQHGGNIRVESAVGAGTTFVIRLPTTVDSLSKRM